ncbi:MAG: class I SAM-dependent methyltransferase, partial [Candidatus Competibacterales bacterium]
MIMGKTRFAPRLHDEWCQLRQWYQTPLGQRFYASELASLSSILPLLFGYHLLTVGTPVQGALISSPTRHQYHLDYYSSPRMGSVAKPHALGWASALPVASDSVDVLVLSHVFEVDPAPDAILAEVERVLIPEGHVVILGF